MVVQRRWISAVLGLGLLAIAPRVARAEAVVGQQPDSTQVVVRVVNNNWLDVRVYARTAGGLARLGAVGSFTSEELRVPPHVTASGHTLELVVFPLGSNTRHASLPILVSAGDLIEWRIENNLSLSSVRVIGGG